jgi:plastocyanin
MTARRWARPVLLLRRIGREGHAGFAAGRPGGGAAARSAWIAPAATALLLAAVAGAAVASTGTRFVVSQRGRMFLPGVMTIRQGDTLQIVNDDGDLMHHAYIDDPTFSFDSGDQEPGTKTDVTFTKLGTFTVLCGIHPKMRLVVSVRE